MCCRTRDGIEDLNSVKNEHKMKSFSSVKRKEEIEILEIIRNAHFDNVLTSKSISLSM